MDAVKSDHISASNVTPTNFAWKYLYTYRRENQVAVKLKIKFYQTHVLFLILTRIFHVFWFIPSSPSYSPYSFLSIYSSLAPPLWYSPVLYHKNGKIKTQQDEAI